MERILCLGDSNTYGYDPRSYIGSRYPEDVRWTGRLKREGREVINRGQNGQCIYRTTAFPGLKRQLTGRAAPDRILLMLGTNDVLLGTEPEDCGERMEGVLRFLRGEAERAQILLIAPPPLQPGDWVETADQIVSSLQLSEVYAKLAEKMGTGFADAGDWNVELCFDGVHFSPEGHAAFALGLEEVLRNTEKE